MGAGRSRLAQAQRQGCLGVCLRGHVWGRISVELSFFGGGGHGRYNLYLY